MNVMKNWKRIIGKNDWLLLQIEKIDHPHHYKTVISKLKNDKNNH